MSESKRKSRSRAAVLASEERCIYCEQAPDQLEHMPPRSMFLAQSRPSGMEYAACEACNVGTSGADAVAAFFARLHYFQNREHPQLLEALQLRPSIERNAPGVFAELFREGRNQRTLNRTPAGLWLPAVEVRADGPLLKGYLSVFGAKLGMALYREHVGCPLPMHGAAYSAWFLNAGMSQELAAGILRIMPMGVRTLAQGKFQVGEQFAYRFNTDGKTIVAALTAFHRGLYILNIATEDPTLYGPALPDIETSSFLTPGELVAHIPPPGERYWSKAHALPFLDEAVQSGA